MADPDVGAGREGDKVSAWVEAVEEGDSIFVVDFILGKEGEAGDRWDPLMAPTSLPGAHLGKIIFYVL